MVFTKDTVLLVDAGISAKQIKERMSALGLDPNTLDGILITHEHSDHIKGLAALAKLNRRIFTSKKTLDEINLSLDSNKEKNNITILVENLGFDKGFSGDTNNPRGLVFFDTVPHIDVDFSINEKLSFERGKQNLWESSAPYLLRITSEFDIEQKINHTFAKYILLKNFPYRRATIFLNGYKIGRYIKRANVQEKFYLLTRFLKEHNQIDIVVWQREKNIPTIWDFKNEAKNVIIEIGNEYHYQLFK